MKIKKRSAVGMDSLQKRISIAEEFDVTFG